MEQILGPLLQRASARLGGASARRRALRPVLERAAERAVGVAADVEVDPISGALSVMVFRRVVEQGDRPDEITLAEARAIDAGVELGDELGCGVRLDQLGPYLRGALVVPAEQYDALHELLHELMWDHDVLAAVPVRASDSADVVARLVARLRDGPFAERLLPGCDPVELEAHEMMLGGMLPRPFRELLAGIGGMQPVEGAPGLCLGEQGHRLLSPLEAQQHHAEWTRRHERPLSAVLDGEAPRTRWSIDWVPMAVGRRSAEDTALLVVDPLGSTADKPGGVLCLSLEQPGFWVLGVDVAGLSYVWHMLALHDLLEHQRPGAGDPIVAGKAEAMVRHLLPDLRWVDAD